MMFCHCYIVLEGVFFPVVSFLSVLLHCCFVLRVLFHCHFVLRVLFHCLFVLRVLFHCYFVLRVLFHCRFVLNVLFHCYFIVVRRIRGRLGEESINETPMTTDVDSIRLGDWLFW